VELGENEAVTPSGKPEADNLALPVNPYSGVNAMADVTVLPGFNNRELGVLDNVNVGPRICRVKLDTAVNFPEVPEMVSVLVPVGAVALA
jgi:hypothetical protein